MSATLTADGLGICPRDLFVHFAGSAPAQGTLSLTVQTSAGTQTIGLGGSITGLTYAGGSTVYFHVHGSALDDATPYSYSVNFPA